MLGLWSEMVLVQVLELWLKVVCIRPWNLWLKVLGLLLGPRSQKGHDFRPCSQQALWCAIDVRREGAGLQRALFVSSQTL